MKTGTRLLAILLLAAVLGIVGVRSAATPPTAEASPLAVRLLSPDLCFFLLVDLSPGGYVPLPCLNDFPTGPDALKEIADLHAGNGDGVVEMSDFDKIDLGLGQIHQKDGAIAGDVGLAVVVQVGTVAPVDFHTDAGTWKDSGATEWLCTTQDADCGGPGTPDGFVVGRLLCSALSCSQLGPQEMYVSQGPIAFPKTFTVVGEPSHIEFMSLETSIQAGVDNCPLPGSASGFVSALGEAEKTVVVGRVLDSQGTSITGGLVTWNAFPPGQALVAGALTPTIDLGTFGVGAPQVVCAMNGAKPGPVTVGAETVTGTLGYTFDPFAGKDIRTLDFNIVGPPAAISLTATPPSLVCDGVASSEIDAAVTDTAGTKAVNGTKVRFDAQALGNANPINATTSDGVAKTVITPLSAELAGVTVNVTAGSVQQAILIQCTGGGVAPAGGEAGAGAAGPTGQIRPPSTGQGMTQERSSPSWAGLLALGAGMTGLPLVRLGLRRLIRYRRS